MLILFAEDPKVPVLASLLVVEVPFKPDVIFSTVNPVSADGLLHTLKSYWVLDVLLMEVTVVAVVLQPF